MDEGHKDATWQVWDVSFDQIWTQLPEVDIQESLIPSALGVMKSSEEQKKEGKGIEIGWS